MDATKHRERPAPLQSPQGGAWEAIRTHAQALLAREPVLSGTLESDVLTQHSLEQGMTQLLSRKLADVALPAPGLRELLIATLDRHPRVAEAAQADLAATCSRDPAAADLLGGFLHYKRFHALQAHRVAHELWLEGRREVARLL